MNLFGSQVSISSREVMGWYEFHSYWGTSSTPSGYTDDREALTSSSWEPLPPTLGSSSCV